MIKWLTRSEIDSAAWNECVKDSSLELPYAFTWYLDIVCENYGALVLNDYEAVMPLPFRNKMGINYIYQPFFTQQLGICGSIDISKALIQDFLDAIPATYKYVDLHFNERNKIGDNSYFSMRHTSHLNLNTDYESIAKGYNSNTKRNIKKATQNQIEYIDSAEELIDIFSRQKPQSQTGLAEKDYDKLKAIVAECHRRKVGHIAVLKVKEEIAAGVFMIKMDKKIIWLFPVLNQKFKDQLVLFSLTDQIIKEHANKDFILDFEGSMIPSVQRIYDGFGAEKIIYPHYKVNNLPWYLKWMKD